MSKMRKPDSEIYPAKFMTQFSNNLTTFQEQRTILTVPVTENNVRKTQDTIKEALSYRWETRICRFCLAQCSRTVFA
jgi:hypothetical protein